MAALAVVALGTLPAATAKADPDSSALRAATSRAEILRHAQRLQAVALSNENTRLTASAGNFESLDYVITKLREYGYNPTLLPYANTQAPNAWSEKTPSVLEQVTPNQKTYLTGVPNGFAAMTWSTNADFTAQVIPAKRIQIPPPATNNTVRSGCSMDDFPPEVAKHRARAARLLHRAGEGHQRQGRRRHCTAAARFGAPSLSNSSIRRCLIVPGARNIVAPISALVFPAAASRRISVSRGAKSLVAPSATSTDHS